MAIANADIAEALDRIGDLLEIQGANVFRIRAYHNAARTVAEHPESIAAMVGRGEDLSKLPGIGKDLAAKITGMVESGHLAYLEELEAETPGGLADLMRIRGLGAKRVAVLHEQLGIENERDLAAAARAGKLRAVAGFGEKTERRILEALARSERSAPRTKIHVAEQIAEPLLAHLRETDGVKQAVIAGSYRRRRETVGDIDILVTCAKGATVMDRLVGYDEVRDVLAKGTTRSSVVLRSGLQVDVRVVPQASYGAALLYFTGSKAHNIALRTIGAKKGLKINEYGAFKGKRRVAGKTEKEVYRQVGLPYIEPELREDRGEIEAARKKKLPGLITTADLRGDLHAHTNATDGRDTLAEMAEAARARGYRYLAISDHTRAVAVAHGQDPARVRRQIDAIDRLNDELDGLVLLKSAEVDILEGGRLDLPNSVLERLDMTVCAVHSKLGLSEKKQTERVIRAMDNRYFTIFAHPSGRLINERDPCRLDMGRVMEAALERGCFLEVNAQPDRLDLDDVHCRMAKEMGLKMAISTDAHRTTDLDKIRFGIGQARRGWLEPDDVINTRPLGRLRKLLARR